MGIIAAAVHGKVKYGEREGCRACVGNHPEYLHAHCTLRRALCTQIKCFPHRGSPWRSAVHQRRATTRTIPDESEERRDGIQHLGLCAFIDVMNPSNDVVVISQCTGKEIVPLRYSILNISKAAAVVTLICSHCREYSSDKWQQNTGRRRLSGATIADLLDCLLNETT